MCCAPPRRTPQRTRIQLIVQASPTGTAHAVLAAAEWVNDRPFLVLNADNLYEEPVIAALAAAPGPACAAFDADSLVGSSNFGADRIDAFALLQVANGRVVGIVEKPTSPTPDQPPGPRLVSMNLWRFDTRIFGACGAVARSVRGEFELPEAVQLAIATGMSMDAILTHGGVLDLSSRADVAAVADLLGQREIAP